MTNHCTIMFTINPNIDKGFDIKLRYKKNKHILLRLYGKNSNDIFEIAKEIKKEIKIYDNYITDISYKTCPNSIRLNKKLRKRLLRLFVRPNNTQMHHSSWDMIQSYIDLYGKAPDFSKYYIPKINRKIKNYIEHVLNTKITNDQLNYFILEFEKTNNK